jgi:hypothetical protein
MIRANTERSISTDYQPHDIKTNSHFCAELNNARSSFKLKSTSINCAPANNCMIIPDVTTGVIPNSINVPLFEAKIARIQYKGSDESDDMIPYSGT